MKGLGKDKGERGSETTRARKNLKKQRQRTRGRGKMKENLKEKGQG